MNIRPFREYLDRRGGASEPNEEHDFGRQLRRGGAAIVGLGVAGLAIEAVTGVDSESTIIVTLLGIKAGAALTASGLVIDSLE